MQILTHVVSFEAVENVEKDEFESMSRWSIVSFAV